METLYQEVLGCKSRKPTQELFSCIESVSFHRTSFKVDESGFGVWIIQQLSKPTDNSGSFYLLSLLSLTCRRPIFTSRHHIFIPQCQKTRRPFLLSLLRTKKTPVVPLAASPQPLWTELQPGPLLPQARGMEQAKWTNLYGIPTGHYVFSDRCIQNCSPPMTLHTDR